MHLLKHRDPKPKALMKCLSNTFVPSHRRLRCRRFDEHGNFLGITNPPKAPNPIEQENVRRAIKAGHAMPLPTHDSDSFDLRRYRPLPGKILLKRPPPVAIENGVSIPEARQKPPGWWTVISVGAGVTVCEVGQRVVIGRGHKPKSIKLGQPFHLALAGAVVGIIE